MYFCKRMQKRILFIYLIIVVFCSCSKQQGEKTNAVYYWTQATTKRAIPAEKVAVYGEQHHLKGTIYNNVESAYKQALKDADKDDFVFVGGSSYIVSDLLEKLNF